MSIPIKFRALDKKKKEMIDDRMLAINQKGELCLMNFSPPFLYPFPQEEGYMPKEGINKLVEIMLYIGLKDKKGKEIYELMELNNKYIVVFKDARFVLQDISTSDIIDIDTNKKYEITREYSPIQKDS